MAANQDTYQRNLVTGQTGRPWVRKGLFAAGASVPIKRGELLELTGGGSTEWVPLDSDFDMSSGGGDIAIADEEIKDGDRAGYYRIIIIRPGDVLRLKIDTASAVIDGDAVYFDDSQTVSLTGTNIIGHTVGQDHFPDRQGHLADDDSPDAGTTIRSTAEVEFTVEVSNSFYARLQQ